MRNVARIESDVRGIKSGQKYNPAALKAQENKIDQIKSNYDKVLNWINQRSNTKLLMDGSLPEIPANDTQIRTNFPGIYVNAIKSLYESLNAGQPPDQLEIERMELTIKDEFNEELAAKASGEEVANPMLTGGEDTENYYLSGLVKPLYARRRPPTRAAVQVARGIWWYADPDYSLEVITQAARAPRVGQYVSSIDVWDAQLSYWIQKDVIDSLMRINQLAADAVRATGDEPWVGNMPIKDLISIRTSRLVTAGSVPSSGGARGAGPAAAVPYGSPQPFFTGSVSGKLFDIAHFTLKLVVDSRDIPLIIDEICKDKFHTLIQLEYEMEQPNLNLEEKIYGPEPAVTVIMDFETSLYSQAYRPLMPNAILDELGL
jgi:hypothetical protein